ncbi:MAG: hypothetical protein LBP87_12745 [Planctomycetaceae bacterium]|jgi:hypothetical protein|nr:hypothetical protein [Planctomycetaceae bacterium]
MKLKQKESNYSVEHYELLLCWKLKGRQLFAEQLRRRTRRQCLCLRTEIEMTSTVVPRNNINRCDVSAKHRLPFYLTQII